MSEKLAEVFEQYEVTITGLRKGRGATILSAKEGSLILEVFRGNITRLEQEYVLNQVLKKQGYVHMDWIIPNKDGMLFTCDKYRQPYVMKKYFEGNECDMHNLSDLIRSIQLLAEFHHCAKKAVHEYEREWRTYQKNAEQIRMNEIKTALQNGEDMERISHIYDIRESVLLEMLAHEGTKSEDVEEIVWEKEENLEGNHEIYNVLTRHSRELKKIYKYIGNVKKKNAFEKLFLQVFQTYDKQARYCVAQLKDENKTAFCQVEKQHYGICHGSFNQHNIILQEDKGAIVHLERFAKGNQLHDLYQFARKVMEKNHYDYKLLCILLQTYSEKIHLTQEDYRYIYVLFLYPEKFWKIANSYYNSNKAFISPKYIEKLQNVILQEEEKRQMLMQFGTLQG